MSSHNSKYYAKKISDSCKKIDLLFEQSVLKVNSEIDENIKADGGETLTSTNSATLDNLEVRKVKNDGNLEIAENTSNAVGREMSTSSNSATLDSLEVHKVIINNSDGNHDESDYQSTSCHPEDMDHQDQEVKQVPDGRLFTFVRYEKRHSWLY